MLPADEDIETPAILPPLKGSTAGVACGWLHTLALEYGGGVQAWGANQVGGRCCWGRARGCKSCRGDLCLLHLLLMPLLAAMVSCNEPTNADWLSH